MLRDVVDQLQADGQEVVVLTSRSNYVELAERSGLTSGGGVFHIPMLQERFRLLNWLLFLLCANMIVPLLRWDRCVLLTDPPFLVMVALLVRVFHWKPRKVFWWTMDLYPEALVARGMLKPDRWPDRLFRAVNEIALRCLSGIVCLGECQLQRLSSYRNWRCVAANTCIVPPWDNRDIRQVDRHSNRVLRQLDLQGQRVALYAGNLGEAHQFRRIVEAARLAAMDEKSRWVFVFAVRGGKARCLADAVQGLPNVRICEYFPEDWTADLLWAAEVHLITMEQGWEGVVVPSKLYAAIKTGAPIVFIGPENSDTAREIALHGLGRVLPVDVDGRVVLDTLNGILQEPGRLEPRRLEGGERQVAGFVTAK